MIEETTKHTGTHQIQRLLPRHFKMLELTLAGMSQVAIAEMIGCTRQSVGIVQRSPIFRKELQQRQVDMNTESVKDVVIKFTEQAQLVLDNNSRRAAECQVDLLDADDDSVRLRASASILDRALGKPEGSNSATGPTIKVEIQANVAQLLMTALSESKEIYHDSKAAKVTDGQESDNLSDGPENGQTDVHQAPELSAGVGHRPSEAQAPLKESPNDGQVHSSKRDDETYSSV